MALECGNNWQEMSGGKLGTLINSRHTRATYKMKDLITQAKGQWAACDTLPQALQHDLVMAALFKRTTHG